MFPPLPLISPPPIDLSGAGGMHNALIAAANQQAAQNRQAGLDQQAKDQRDFENRLQLANAGATQDADTGSTHPGGPTLKLGDKDQDSARQARKGTKIRDPQGGGDWYVPTAEEKATKKAANDPENFVPTGQLAEMLKTGGWDGKKPMTPAQSHTLMQALNLAAPKDEPFHIDTTGKFLDAQGKPAAVMIGDKTGKVRLLDLSGMNAAAQPGAAGPATPGAATGGPFDTSQAQSVAPGDTASMDRTESPGYGFSPKKGAPGAAPGGPFSFAPPQKDERADTQSILPGQQGPNGGILVFNKDTKSVEEINVPKGSKGVMTAAQTEADKDRDAARATAAGDRAERKGERADTKAEAKKAVFRGIETVKRKALAEAQKTYRKSLETAIDPESKKAAADQLRSDVNDAQTEYESSIGDETGNKISHNDWAKGVAKEAPAAKTPPKTTAKPAQPVAAQPAKAVTHEAPPASVTKGLAPGTHTFGNKQVWRKGADGTMTYVSGGE